MPCEATGRDGVTCYRIYYDGRPQDAAEYCERAAEAGDAVGKHLLGVMLLRGEGIAENKTRGIALLKNAAESGRSDAQKDYGMSFQHGLGVAKDMVQACDWWEKSALQENRLSLQYVAGCYLTGEGRKKDLAKGYAYLLLAASRGNDQAPQLLKIVRPSLSSTELREAEKLASDLSRKP